jgi:hypothetical protein
MIGSTFADVEVNKRFMAGFGSGNGIGASSHPPNRYPAGNERRAIRGPGGQLATAPAGLQA